MLDAEERMEISVLSRHGGSIRSIARATGRSRNTVRRYLRGGDDIAVRRKPAAKRIAKLDPFKDYILERLRAAAPDKNPGGGSVPGDPPAWLSGRRDTGEGLHPKLAATASARSGGAFRDRARPADAGGLGLDPGRQEPPIGLCGNARLEPGGLYRVLRRRTSRDSHTVS
jgi:hypothetical protein